MQSVTVHTPKSLAPTKEDRAAVILPIVRFIVLDNDLSELWYVDHGETFDLTGEAVYHDEFTWGDGAIGDPILRALRRRWRS